MAKPKRQELFLAFSSNSLVMKVTIFLLVSLLTVCVASELNWELNCKQLHDGHYYIGCRSYIECSKGKKTQVYCKKGEFYNINTKKCDSGHVPEPCGVKKDCSKKADGRYPDLGRACHFYYVCTEHKFMLHLPCPAGLVLNPALGVCDWKGNVPQPCGTKGA